MVCYSPQPACYSKAEYAKTGKKSIHLVMKENYDENGQVLKDTKYLYNERYFPHALYTYFRVPCGKCTGCRSDNAKMWSLRAQHEMRMHDSNCFITLTYANESVLVQQDPLCLCSLRYKHFQNFMKRLRKKLPDHEISYLVCGEYGLKDGRAHWHAILFGIDFSDLDRELVYVSKGFPHYRSQILEDAWSTYDKDTETYIPIGFVDLANCDVDCCNYVSQYVLKKLPVGMEGVEVGHYIDEYGEIKAVTVGEDGIGVAPPMVRSSRNPAIGKRWFDQYGDNAVEKGFVYSQNNKKTSAYKMKVPKYYYDKFEDLHPEEYQKIKLERERLAKIYNEKHPPDYDELSRREVSHLTRIKNRIKECLTNFR